MATTEAASDKVLLDVKGLVKQFPIPGSKKVVHACSDVTITLKRGETLGVIGESGSGKTTLGRCILRLIEPTSGEVVFDGTRVTGMGRSDLRKLRTDMQIVFQEPFDSLNPQMIVGRQIAEPLRIHTNMNKEQRRQRVRELLEFVRLPPSTYDAVPRQLSPGALQRASIARAIATSPKLVVLDEPTSALAPEAEAEVIGLLKDLQKELGLAYIFISHDLSLVGEICDKVAIMYLSQVVEYGSRDDVFEHPRHPYSRALLASVLLPDPTQRRDSSDRAERLEGEIPSPIDLPRGCYLASRCPYVTDRCREQPQPSPRSADHSRCWRMARRPHRGGDRAHARGASRAVRRAGLTLGGARGEPDGWAG
ncbi:MAG: ABC transporter ATP-binding protein [Thermoleophilia bacterium]